MEIIIIPRFWNIVFMHVTFSKLSLIKRMFQILEIIPNIVSVLLVVTSLKAIVMTMLLNYVII